ncbi:hypothetical protein AAJ76_1460003382 [Vairimorpha ceranae]|uniref:Uncharacterized protein n=1 Tax=Vairimorpha ceranae TaxID=40302 RepID=A0A0F9WLP3_9MICR|nr:hypothetical protein AAJ76_1460003382 [Vairimorpha ceranae]KKO73998.1 hypothetical protein AAJ76_1460003382 [Vairimorpha ceranae]
MSGISFIDTAYKSNYCRKKLAVFQISIVRQSQNLVKSSVKLGGLDKNGIPRVVEINESLFFKQKYNCDRLRDGQWFVGGAEDGSKKCFMLPVENRNAATLA